MFSVRSLTSAAKSAMRPIAPSVNRSVSAFGREQRRVLLDERALRLGEDADEVLAAERLELDADRKAALQLGNQVRRLRDVERAGGDEEDVVGLDHAVLGVDGRAFDDRQDVALHAFAADVGPVAAFAPGDLVDLVDEDDARLLHAIDRGARDACPCRRASALLPAPAPRAPRAPAACRFFVRPWNSPGSMSLTLMSTSSTDEPAMISNDGKRLLAHVDLDLLVIEPAVAQLLAQLLARALRLLADARRLLVVVGRRRQRRQQQIEHALFGGLPRLLAHFGDALFADHVDGELGQVAHHRLDVAADVADLGELRRLDLDERRLREPRQPARDLGLADAGRADHQDVLRRDLLGQLRRQLLPARAVAQRDRDGALGLCLADDVLVELARRSGAGSAPRRSTTWFPEGRWACRAATLQRLRS